MAYIEIDSFVEKFKNLWHAGLKASLTVEAEHGQASITLRAGLGSIPPPFHPPRPQTPRPYRGPAYHRRQERRQAARAAAEIVGAHTEQVSDLSHNDVVNEGEDQVADKATEHWELDGGLGGGVGLSFKKSLLESKKPPYLFIWVMYRVDQMVYQLVQAYRSQESSSSWLLLTSLLLLDSLIAEAIVLKLFLLQQ
jgi:hypothetical protein